MVQRQLFLVVQLLFGNPLNDFISENDEINPVNPYGSTKAIVEKILNNLYESDSEKWRIANLRYFNAIGAHESGLIEKILMKFQNLSLF